MPPRPPPKRHKNSRRETCEEAVSEFNIPEPLVDLTYRFATLLCTNFRRRRAVDTLSAFYDPRFARTSWSRCLSESLFAVVILERIGANKSAFRGMDKPFLAIGEIGGFADGIVGNNVQNEVL